MYVDNDIRNPIRMSLIYQCNKTFEENTIDSYKRNKDDPVKETIKILIDKQINPNCFF